MSSHSEMMQQQSWIQNLFLMIKVVCPLLLLFGTFGNIMTITVFLRMNDQSAMSTYLVALAISDLIFLYFGMTSQQWLQSQWDFDVFCVNTVTCKMIVAVHYMSGALSSWYLVAMTMQRAMSVVWPHRVKVICTRSVSRVVTTCITLAIIASYSHILYGISLTPTVSAPLCVDSLCNICLCYPVSPEYEHFFFSVFSYVDLVIGSLVPFILLLVSNIVLVRAVLTSAENVRQRLSASQSANVTSREKKVSSLSVTLIVLSVTFLVLTAPVRVQMVSYPYFAKRETINGYISYFIFYSLNILCAVNSVLNFYVYCLTGTKFRKVAARLLCILLD